MPLQSKCRYKVSGIGRELPGFPIVTPDGLRRAATKWPCRYKVSGIGLPLAECRHRAGQRRPTTNRLPRLSHSYPNCPHPTRPNQNRDRSQADRGLVLTPSEGDGLFVDDYSDSHSALVIRRASFASWLCSCRSGTWCRASSWSRHSRPSSTCPAFADRQIASDASGSIKMNAVP